MFHRLLFSMAATGLCISSVCAAPLPPSQTLQSATEVLDDLAAIPLKGIPPALLNDAQGVAIIPRVVKAGFIVGGRGGHGVVLVRGNDGAWGHPTFVSIGGASIGFQAGVESADVVLVFKTRKSLDRILEGKGKVTLGVDAAIAVGPLGRQVEAGTDARMQAEIVSYSRSRGVFAGVALDGAGVVYDREANESFARDTRREVRDSAEALIRKLTAMNSPATSKVPAIGTPVLQPPIAPVR